MKVNEIVIIRDGSFMYHVQSDGQTSRETDSTPIIGHCRDPFIILATNIRLPGIHGVSYPMDTVIKNMATGEEWICIADINLKPYSKHPKLKNITLDELLKLQKECNDIIKLFKSD